MIVYFPFSSEGALWTATFFEVQVVLSARACLLRDLVSRALVKHAIPSFESSYRSISTSMTTSESLIMHMSYRSDFG